jgi:biotin transport system substrate-specific component
MSSSRAASNSLGAALLDGEGGRAYRLTVAFGLALIGSLFIAVSARLQVPFYPVPMTMQTFAITLVAAAYGGRLAAATMLLYLAEGAFGLPVFANTPERGIGLAYMVGPTGGYLVGYTLAAIAIGHVVDRGWAHSLWRLGAVMAVAMVPVYLLGALWLAQFTGFAGAFAAGVAPFVLGDVLKVALSVACVGAARRALIHRG